MKTKLDYRPDIDGLRAIAVLLVVVFHFNLIPEGKSGFMGVDVFYVISGYLITAILIRQLDAGTFSFSSFYLHRVRRLAPALFAVLGLVMLAGWVLLFPAGFVDLSKQVLASQLYVANIYYWRSINYFGLQADNVYLLHTWSLAVEEQFYLVFPLVIFLIYRYWRSWLWPILSFGFAASFALNLWFVSSKPEATFYLLPTRAWEMLAGSLAYWVASRFNGSRGRNDWLGKVGLVLIAVGVVAFSEEMAFPGVFALLPVIGAALVLIGGSGHPTAISSLLSMTPVVYVGRISYTLYLVHWPVNVFAHQVFALEYTILARTVMFAISVVLSMAIFHLIEQPVRSGRFRLLHGSGIAWGYLVGLAATVGVALFILFMHGLPQRFPAEAMRMASFVKDATLVPECEFHGQKLDENRHFCRIGAQGVEPDWLIYGDSHAAAAYGAFDQWLAGEGKAGLFMFKSACLPIAGIHMFKDKGLCHAFNDAIGKFLEKQKSIVNVLLVSCWRQPIEKGGISSDGLSLVSREKSVGLFYDKFGATVKRFNGLGKWVFVWEPVPGARGSVPVEMAKSLIAGQGADIEFRLDEYLNDFDFFFQALVQQNGFISQTFSPSAALCQTGRCRVAHNGDPLYHDNAHVSASSAGFWADMLRHQYRQ